MIPIQITAALLVDRVIELIDKLKQSQAACTDADNLFHSQQALVGR
jgi:hypothetical protein